MLLLQILLIASALVAVVGKDVSGYFYVNVYENDNCSDTIPGNIAYTAGYALNHCFVQYNTTGHAISSTKFTCSATTNGAISNITYADTNCSVSPVYSMLVAGECALSKASSNLDGVTYGLTYSLGCIGSDITADVDALPIFADSVVNTGYPADADCEGPIYSYTALGLNSCYSDKNLPNNVAKPVCSNDIPSLYLYPISDSTCSSTTAFKKANYPSTCTSVTDIAGVLPKTTYLANQYVSTCYEAVTPVPTASPTAKKASIAPTVQPTYGSSDGYIYYTYYSDKNCTIPTYYEGYQYSTCLTKYKQEIEQGSGSFDTCNADSTTTNFYRYYNSPKCAGEYDTATPVALNECVAVDNGSTNDDYSALVYKPQYYKISCSTGTAIGGNIVTTPSIIIPTYTNNDDTCSDTPIAFTALSTDNCFTHIDGISSSSYSCNGNNPSKSYYNNATNCFTANETMKVVIDYPTSCTASNDISTPHNYYYYDYDATEVGLYQLAVCYGSESSSSSTPLSTGAIAGIAVGVVGGVGVTATVAYFALFKGAGTLTQPLVGGTSAV